LHSHQKDNNIDDGSYECRKCGTAQKIPHRMISFCSIVQD
jgi:hypothetical protein